jgi:hypothetical protein
VDSEGNKENRHLVLDCNKTNKHKLHQGTQWCPQKQPQRINLASNHWEFHGDDTRCS